MDFNSEIRRLLRRTILLSEGRMSDGGEYETLAVRMRLRDGEYDFGEIHLVFLSLMLRLIDMTNYIKSLEIC